MLSPIQHIRNAAPGEEIDYVFLKGCLQHYAAPRNIINRLLQQGQLIRVKKGLYVFGPEYAKRPYSPEVLANLIYGPSYLSREYALQFYGLIPERVYEVTSMTTVRNKQFDTPIGRFTYRYLRLDRYCVGIHRIEVAPDYHALIATPEKALADMLFVRKEKTTSATTLATILYEDYRLSPMDIAQFKIGRATEIASAYQSPTISLLPALIREAKKHA